MLALMLFNWRIMRHAIFSIESLLEKSHFSMSTSGVAASVGTRQS